MENKRITALIKAGLTAGEAHQLETILNNDEQGKPRTEQDQEFVNQCRLNILKKG